jgi:murein DD-endopeptidase MepM/ murein hydrolase activator NlpD
MPTKWLHSKLTFVIIPEANEGVVRVQLSRWVLYAVIFGLTLILGAGFYWYGVHFRSMAAAHMSPSHNQEQTNRLQQDLTTKNETIDQLQKQIFQLSRQAAEVRSKMDEMRQLEHELRKLTDARESAPDNNAVIAASVNAAAGMDGMGGPPYPATAHQVNALALAANADYAALTKEMNELQANWAESKQSLQKLQDQAQRKPGLWPTLSRNVTSDFGYRRDPFTDKLSFHRGIDIAGKTGDPVYAAAKGTVLTAGFDKFHGHHVVIDHGNGLHTWYMHLNRILVKRGDMNQRGQQVGKLGTSGRSTGPHLHYEIVRDGKSTDPKPYLPTR